MNELPTKQNITESVERLSFLQKKNKYQARDSVMSSYKFTPELSKALGLDLAHEKKASLKQIHIDLENLKRYSRTSIMINSLTNINTIEDPFASQSSGSNNNEEGKFESSKLAMVLKRLQNS